MSETSTTSQGVSYVVVEERAGQRLDNLLLAHLKGVPKSRVYRMIRQGEVRVNGSRCPPSYKTTYNDRIRIPPVQVVAPSQSRSVSEELAGLLRNSVIYSDSDIYVLDKPVGIAVHGGTDEPFGLAEVMKKVLDESNLYLVHRLDKATSGCLVVARNRPAMTHLNRIFRENRVKKTYSLIVQGEWPREHSEVSASLKRFKLPNGERRVRVEANAQSAITSFKVTEQIHTRATWLEAKPVTGRTHQIRVHTQYMGHPIVGDRKYGDRSFKPRATRLMLHAYQIGIPDMAEVTAPVPSTFTEYWQGLASQLEG